MSPLRAHWVLALLAVQLLPAPLTPAAAQGGMPFTFPAAPGDATTVNITAQAGSSLLFIYDPGAFPGVPEANAVFVSLNRSGGSERLDVNLQRGTQWVGSLPIATADLVTGTWTVACLVLAQDGTLHKADQRVLTVVAADTQAPTLEVEGVQGSQAILGPADFLRVTVSDLTLRRVTWKVDGLPAALDLPAPYQIAASSLHEGVQNLTLQAYDRTGLTSGPKTLTVVVDAHPPVLAVTHPVFAFLNTTFTVTVTVSEITNYTLRVDGLAPLQVANATGLSGVRTHLFQVKPAQLGNATLLVEARDALGNLASNRSRVPVLRPQADYSLTLLQASPARPLASEEVVLSYAIRQEGGPAGLNVTIQWTGLGLAPTSVRPVPLGATGTALRQGFVNVRLPPGQHALAARVEPPAGITDTNLTNQEIRLDLEVFLGRLARGNATYDIRAGANGLPGFAVGPDGTAYPLQLQDRGLGAVYTFQVAGQTLEWSPIAQTGTSSSEPTTGSSDTPLPLALAAAALLAGALARRRRTA